MLHLGVPVALGELAWIAMSTVDTLMVGRLGPEALGAVSLGRFAFMSIGVFGIGMLLGLDSLVSQAFGAGRFGQCGHWLRKAMLLTAIVAPLLWLAVLAALRGILAMDIDPGVAAELRRYGPALGFAMVPLLVYTALRRYLQAINRVRPVMLALISANLVNVLGNWALIHGKLGMPALGVAGAAWSTAISMSYMAAFLGLALYLEHRVEPSLLRRPAPFAPHSMGTLVRVGLPAAVYVTLEVGAFGMATLMAGHLEPAALAAHQIAIVVASTTYMVPLGLSSAAAVRVGHAVGRRDAAGADVAGWAAMAIAGGFMTVAAVVLFAMPRTIAGWFTPDLAVREISVGLLYVAALFQLSDGVCVAAIGALRGAGDTRTPMIWNLLGYWLLALPLAWLLAFRLDIGAFGIWIGLCAGMILISVVMVVTWRRLTARLASELAAPRRD